MCPDLHISPVEFTSSLAKGLGLCVFNSIGYLGPYIIEPYYRSLLDPFLEPFLPFFRNPRIFIRLLYYHVSGSRAPGSWRTSGPKVYVMLGAAIWPLWLHRFGSFRKLGVPYFRVHIIRILLQRKYWLRIHYLRIWGAEFSSAWLFLHTCQAAFDLRI